jgi:hypothetical protein
VRPAHPTPDPPPAPGARSAARPGAAPAGTDRLAGAGLAAARADAPGGDRAARAAPARRDHATDPVVMRVVAGGLVAVLAVGLALVEAFLVPLRVGTVPLPICVPLAIAGNIGLAKLAARQTGSIVWGAVPPVLWLLVIVVLSLPRSEGDLVVPGTLTGLVFLFAGAVSGAYGVASEITRRAGAAGRTRR